MHDREPAAGAESARALPWWRRWRTLLLAAFLLVAAVVGLAELLAIQRAAGRAEAAALAQTGDAARALAAATDFLMARYRASARALAEVIFEAEVSPQQRRRLLESVHIGYPEITLVSVLDQDGRVIDASRSGAIGGDASDRRFFRRLAAGESDAAMELVFGRYERALQVGIAAARRRPGGALLGVVAIAVSPEVLSRELGALLSGGRYPVVIDRDGRMVVYGSASDPGWAERDLSAVPAVAEALAGGAVSSARFPDLLTGRPSLGALAPAVRLGWAVGVFEPLETALAPAREERRLALATTAAVLALALGLALILGRALARPLTEMAGGVAALSGGDLSHRIAVRSRNEVGQLAQRFNAMAERLSSYREQERAAGDLLVATNEALQRRVVELQTLLDVLPIGVGVSDDPRGRRIRANPALARILGVAPWSEVSRVGAQDAGRPFVLCRNGRELADDELPLRASLATGRPVANAEIEVVRADGARFHLLEWATPLFDERGGVRGGFLAVLDITERQRAEAERAALLARTQRARAEAEAARAEAQKASAELARANEALQERLLQIQTLLDVSPVGIGMSEDPEGRRILANPALARMLGVEPWTNISKSASPDLSLPFTLWRDGRPLVADELPFQRALAQGHSIAGAEIQVVTADGRRLSLLEWATPFFDAEQRVRGGFLAVVDITERQRVEYAQRFLAEASAILASSLDYETTLGRVARLAVPAIADWCFVDLAEGEATRRVGLAHADAASPEVVERLRGFTSDPRGPHPVAQVLASGTPQLLSEVDDAQIRARLAAGDAHYRALREVAPTSWLTVPLQARGRTLGALTLVVTRESGRRFGEPDLPLAEELGRRVSLAIDNARLYREAQEAVAAREAFLARASHELRTPLTSTLASVRLLKQAMAGRQGLVTADLVEMAGRNATAMLALVNDLLDLAKLRARAAPLALERVDLSELVLASREVVQAQAQAKGLALRSDVPPGLVVPVDPVKVVQLLTNLLANAVKFTPAAGEVVVEAQARSDTVVIRVRDTGEGIPAEALDRIFEPFAQIERGRNYRRRGTGLGLPICREIAQLHGGRVWAESPGLGLGSTFTVELPLARRAERAA